LKSLSALQSQDLKARSPGDASFCSIAEHGGQQRQRTDSTGQRASGKTRVLSYKTTDDLAAIADIGSRILCEVYSMRADDKLALHFHGEDGSGE
jgi:hypothetical protein